LATAEERITSKVAGILEELRAVQAQQHATLSVLDTFVKAFLTCVPEPADLAVAKDRARKRYEQFRRALGNGHDGNGA
jgi:hypothetical protein